MDKSILIISVSLVFSVLLVGLLSILPIQTGIADDANGATKSKLRAPDFDNLLNSTKSHQEQSSHKVAIVKLV